jgi:protein-tyrosine phosphatase
VGRLPLRTALPIVAAVARARATRARAPVPYLRSRVLAAVDGGGLPSTYAAILVEFRGELAAALRAVAAAARARRAVLLCCKLGKDRTGLLAALLLTTLGAPRARVLADYAASGGAAPAAAAASVGVPSLAGAPPGALAAVLAWLEAEWGSVEAYLDGAGFGEGEREALRRALGGEAGG